jgi:hypothetical protein
MGPKFICSMTTIRMTSNICTAEADYVNLRTEYLVEFKAMFETAFACESGQKSRDTTVYHCSFKDTWFCLAGAGILCGNHSASRQAGYGTADHSPRSSPHIRLEQGRKSCL